MESRLSVTKRAAKKAGKEVIRLFRKNFKIKKKGKLDILTEADKKSEQIIIREISRNFPNDSIISEEIGSIEKNATYTWVIDPIDGTNNFSRGIPFFCISIGLIKDGKLILGVVHDPFHNEMFHAEKGKNSFLNGKRITVKRTSKIENAIIDINRGHLKNERSFRKYHSLALKSRALRTTGSVALGICYVACGRLDAEINSAAKIWDVAAGAIILSEAGGKITDQKGNPWSPESRTMVACTRPIYYSIMRLLS